MLRERAVGESLWEAVLPAELRQLPAELAKIDGILDDDRFLAPFRVRLTARIGRPTIAIEGYLRLMYLKHRYGLGYETLCKDVSASRSGSRRPVSPRRRACVTGAARSASGCGRSRPRAPTASRRWRRSTGSPARSPRGRSRPCARRAL